MKIRNLTIYKTKLTKLNLINSKFFNKETISEIVNVDQIKYQLKKALKIIYKFHVNDKKILFIGKVDERILQQLKTSKHMWFNQSNKTEGFITNNSFNLRKKENKNNYNLIVILSSDNNENIIKEGYSAKIPTIQINTQLNIFEYKCDYKIPGSFKFANKNIENTSFYFMLQATLKRANYFRQKLVEFKRLNFSLKKTPTNFKKRSHSFKKTNYAFRKKKTN